MVDYKQVNVVTFEDVNIPGILQNVKVHLVLLRRQLHVCLADESTNGPPTRADLSLNQSCLVYSPCSVGETSRVTIKI